MDCIEHFRTMQDCFREFPDVYGGELEEDEQEGEEVGGEVGGVEGMSTTTTEDDGGEVGGVEGMSTTTTEDDGGAEHLENVEGAASLPPAATSALPTPSHEVKTDEKKGNDTERAKKATEQVRREHGEGLSESEEVVPKAALDATGKE